MKFWEINTEIAVRKKYDLPILATFCLNQSEYFAGLLLRFFSLTIILYVLPPPEKDSVI